MALAPVLVADSPIEQAVEQQKADGSKIVRLNGHPPSRPQDFEEAYARMRGPYTVENAEEILDQEPVEIYNGWLVEKPMTNFVERRVLSNAQTMLDLSARNMGFGQALPDQMECLLKSGDVVKPDASLISWHRIKTREKQVGSRDHTVLEGGPELVIESRSPSNTRRQESRKRTQYFNNGVQIIWDIDETKKIIWVYYATNPDKPIEYGLEDEINCEPLLPGWRRKVADIFADGVSAKVVAGEVAEEWHNEGRVEGFSQGKEEGFLEGIEKGRQEGKSEGIAEGLAQVFPLLLQMRFGIETPPDLPIRLAKCNLEELQQLQAAIQTCETVNEWLALLEP